MKICQKCPVRDKFGKSARFFEKICFWCLKGTVHVFLWKFFKDRPSFGDIHIFKCQLCRSCISTNDNWRMVSVAWLLCWSVAPLCEERGIVKIFWWGESGGRVLNQLIVWRTTVSNSTPSVCAIESLYVCTVMFIAWCCRICVVWIRWMLSP